MTEAIWKGLGLGLILTLSVGPVIFTILKQSINNGHKGGFAFVSGVWLSDIFLVILSNMFTEIVRQILEFKSTIAYVGGLFLIGMGLFYVFFKKIDLNTEKMPDIPNLSTTDYAKSIISGFLINTLNPSIFFFWLINATAFAVTNDKWERVLIFSICLLVNMISDILKVLLAGRIRDKLTPRNISAINRISGAILVIFGLALFYGVFFLEKKPT